MCYYVSVKEKNALKGMLNPSIIIEDYPATYFANGFQHPQLPIMTMISKGIIQPAQWGLVPSWVQSVDEARTEQNRTLNARSETMFTTPMYREYASGSRCLIFVDGFFEWEHRGNDKIPHFIYRERHKPIAFGGLYSYFAGKPTCTIVTTEPNELMKNIHHRMPLIISEDLWDKWLNPELPRHDVMDIARPYHKSDLNEHTVKKIKLNADNNKPSVQDPIADSLTLF